MGEKKLISWQTGSCPPVAIAIKTFESASGVGNCGSDWPILPPPRSKLCSGTLAGGIGGSEISVVVTKSLYNNLGRSDLKENWSRNSCRKDPSTLTQAVAAMELAPRHRGEETVRRIVAKNNRKISSGWQARSKWRRRPKKNDNAGPRARVAREAHQELSDGAPADVTAELGLALRQTGGRESRYPPVGAQQCAISRPGP